MIVDVLGPQAAFTAGGALAACAGLLGLLTPALCNTELPDRHDEVPRR
ncbi:hypothetical protein AB0C02_24165 [Micromonospora sp. NPDC048999]